MLPLWLHNFSVNPRDVIKNGFTSIAMVTPYQDVPGKVSICITYDEGLLTKEQAWIALGYLITMLWDAIPETIKKYERTEPNVIQIVFMVSQHPSFWISM